MEINDFTNPDLLETKTFDELADIIVDLGKQRKGLLESVVAIASSVNPYDYSKDNLDLTVAKMKQRIEQISSEIEKIEGVMLEKMQNKS